MRSSLSSSGDLSAVYAGALAPYAGTLTPALLTAEAEAAAGLADWGGERWSEDGFRARLAALCEALETQAQLTPAGRSRAHGRLLGMLVSRLRVVGYRRTWTQEPQVAAPLVGTADDGQVKLVWDDVPGDPLYTLWYSQGDVFDSAAARKIEGAQPGQAVGGLTNGKPYSFKIAARYGDRTSPLSPQVRLVPVGIASGFAAVPGTGKVTLTWTAAEGAASYNLYFRGGAGVDKGDNKVTGVTPPFTLTTLEDGKRYDFALASVSGGSETGGNGAALALRTASASAGARRTCSPRCPPLI